MVQPITSTGYDGTVSEVDWASLSPASSTQPGIVNGFGVTIVGNVDRTIRVGAGQAYGWGVLDTLTGTVDLQADPVTSGSRWDTLVLRRDWQPTPGGGSTLMLLKGTSTKAMASSRQTNPGVLADQVLGAVRVQAGLTTIQEFEDWRQWPSSLSFRFDRQMPSAFLYAYGEKIIQNPTGAFGLDVAVRRGGAGSEYWDMLLARDWYDLSLASGYRAHDQTPRYRVVGDMLQLRGRIERTNGANFNNAYTTVGSVPASAAPASNKFVSVATEFSSTTGGSAVCQVLSSGVVQVIAPAGTASWVSLDGISIPIG